MTIVDKNRASVAPASIAVRPAGNSDLIMAAALDCFERQGIKATRVEDILTEAGISRSTFYRYFSSIDGIVVELAARATCELLEVAVREAAASGQSLSVQAGRAVARVAGRVTEPTILKLITGSGNLQHFSNLIATNAKMMKIISTPLIPLLNSGRAAGVFRAELDADQMAEWLIRNSSSLRMRRPTNAHTQEELEHYIGTFVIPGILAPAGTDSGGLLERLDRLERHIEGMMRSMALEPNPASPGADL